MFYLHEYLYIKKGQFEGLKSGGQFCNQFFSKYTRKPLKTPSACFYSFPLKIKQDSFVASDKSSLNSIFDKPSTFSVFSKSVLEKISIVSSSGMLVERESTSRLPIKNSESCSTIS